MKWRQLVEASALGQDAAETGGLVFGDPATDSQIDEMADRLGVDFSEELRDLYREFNGAGMPFGSENEVAWWIAPLELIEVNTHRVRELIDQLDDEDQQEMADRMVCFGDWMNGDYFGCIAEPDGLIVSPELFLFNHENGRIESCGCTFEELLQV